jgi:signal transduction histidine kinase
MNLGTHWFWYSFFLDLYYATIPAVNGAWLIYLIYLLYPEGSRKLKIALWIAELPLPLYIIIALSNPFTGAFFTLSKDMVYTRGPLFQPVAIDFYTVYAVLGLAFVLLKWKQIHERYNRLFLLTFFLASIFIQQVQVMHPGWLIAEITYAVLFVLCDATVEDEKRGQLIRQIQQQNASLKEAVDNANRANAAKTDFLSRMSHDIRTPINGILGMTYLAKEQDNPPKTKEYLNKIDTSSQFLLGLINDVLDMSHMENQQIELKEEPYNIDELNAYLDSVIKPLCEEKGQKLQIDEKFVSTAGFRSQISSMSIRSSSISCPMPSNIHPKAVPSLTPSRIRCWMKRRCRSLMSLPIPALG